MLNKMSYSPIWYVGGKSKKVKQFEKVLKDNFDINGKTLVSPFCGGCSFEIYISKLIPVICCDIDERLINFWKTLKNDKEGMIFICKNLLPITNDKHKIYFNSLKDNRTSDYEKACLYYVLNRVSYCGKMTTIHDHKKNLFDKLTKEKIEVLRKYNVDNIQFELCDYKETIIKYNNSILYLDPPYYIKSDYLYGENGSNHNNFNHKELCELLKSVDNFILCYNDCPEIREMYKECKIIDINFNYGCGKNENVNELLIVKC